MDNDRACAGTPYVERTEGDKAELRRDTEKVNGNTAVLSRVSQFMSST